MAGVTIIVRYFHFFYLLASYMLITVQEKMTRMPFMVIFIFSLTTDQPTELKSIYAHEKKLETVKFE